MVVLGERNSRIKDFFDLKFLATHFEFDRQTLARAVRQTFERRNTPVPDDTPVAMTDEYWTNGGRAAQLRAFARRAGLAVGAKPGYEIVRVLHSLLSPILDDVRRGEPVEGTWPAGGPWR